jgi:hypothetical protein
MLRKEDYTVIKALKKRGVYHTDIAARAFQCLNSKSWPGPFRPS